MGSKPPVHDQDAVTDPSTPIVRSRIERVFMGLERVAQYDVLGFVAAGGMGQVYRARDQHLERTVAIKVLRPGAGERDRARLVREARAMAKLSHPNVVTVHEVLVEDDAVLLVMEYVEGASLRAWLKERPRSVRDIARVFAQAGRGLAAAHHAGLVHRDFKPDNVLVSVDGRVCVGDFGLASVVVDASTPDLAGGSGDELLLHRSPDFAVAATATGALAGTPAYMAPEQHERRSVDARADQFAFFVSLHEALYGERPSALEPPRRAARVPRWLRRLLVKGLAVDPAQRHPSMDVVCAALDRDPGARLRRAGWVVGVAALTASILLTSVHRREAPPCAGAGGAAQLAGVWDDERREAVRAAFLATGRSYAADTFARLAHIFDDYGSAWSAMRLDACQATAVRHEQSPALLDLRMGCLDRRRNRLGALASIFTTADRRVVDGAVSAASELPELDDCSESKAAATTRPSPDDPVLRVRVDAIWPRVDVLLELYRTGRIKGGLATSKALAVEALAVPYPPLQSEALERRETFECLNQHTADCEATARQLTTIAADARDDQAVARAWIRILSLVEGARGREAEVPPVRLATEAALHRAGDPPKLRALMLNQRAGLLLDNARLDEAAAAAAEAIAALSTLPQRYDLYFATSLNVLGAIADRRGRLDEALDAFERARALWELRLGPEHPWVAGGTMNVALVLDELGRRGEAIAALARARDIQERILEPDDPDAALTLQAIGTIRHEQGLEDEAQALLERILPVEEALRGPRRSELGTTLKVLADVRLALGRRAEAEKLYARATTVTEEVFGPDHPDVASDLAALADALRADGRLGEARKDAERALALATRASGADDLSVTEPLLALGAIARAEGKLDEALASDRRALAVVEKAYGPDRWQSAPALDAIGADLLPRQPDGALASHARALAASRMTLSMDDPALVPSLVGIGEALDALGRPIDAIGPLQEAIVLSARRPAAALAEPRFALARSLWDAGRGPAAAAALAHDAHAGFVADGAKADATRVASWLRQRHL